jgi:predicted amidohydrolase
MTFFARHIFKDEGQLNSFFEHALDISQAGPGRPLFEEARTLSIDVYVGYAEKTPAGHTFNSAIYYSASMDKAIAKYRKVHIPGTKEPLEKDEDAMHHLEKRNFQPGDIDFPAFCVPGLFSSQEVDCPQADAVLGMLICSDRRWPEAWRCYGLQGVELILCGYNTPGYNPSFWGMQKSITPAAAERRIMAQHKLVMQANSYMNSCFSIAAGKAGLEDGQYSLIGGSCIVSPEGEVLAEAVTMDDEVIAADIDLDDCRQGKEKVGLGKLSHIYFVTSKTDHASRSSILRNIGKLNSTGEW